MSNMLSCRWCGGNHLLDNCPARIKKVLSTNAEPLSTQAKVLSTEPLSTLGEVASVRLTKSQKQSGYERLKKWRQTHREEYNAQMRKKRGEV